MDKHILAEQLRRIKESFDPLFILTLANFSDDEIISSYNKCYCCKENFFNNDDLELFIQTANNVQEFIDNTKSYIEENKRKNDIARIKKEKKYRRDFSSDSQCDL